MHPIHLYVPLWPCTPHISVHPCTPVHLYFPLYHIFPMCHWDLGESVHPICLGVFWGASVHLSGISVSIITSICLSVHSSHTSCSPSLWVDSLLDWMPVNVCYASYCCSFLCSVFIISHASTTMCMTTTPPVTVVCYCMSSLLSMVTMVPSLMRIPAISGQHDVVLIPRHSGCVVGLATVPQQ